MKYIRTEHGHIFEVVDYEQLDENTKKNVRQHRCVGLEDYLNEKIFVKIHQSMPDPISQYQPIKMFDILKQANTIDALCDYCVYYNAYKDLVFRKLPLSTSFASLYRDLQKGYINDVKLGILTDKGLIFVARMNDKGELELL